MNTYEVYWSLSYYTKESGWVKHTVQAYDSADAKAKTHKDINNNLLVIHKVLKK